MEKQSGKEILGNIAKKKFTFVIIIILIILSGFLLFNHISYLSKNYKPTKQGQNKANDSSVNIKILIFSFIPLISLMFIPLINRGKVLSIYK
jgi:uncharacterized membrane protein